MNILIAFLFGLLIGWLVEWAIDWLYWRKKSKKVDDLIERVNSADQEIAELKTRLVACGDIKADKLEKIHGIGPVISKEIERCRYLYL